MSKPVIPMILRGRIITDCLTEIPGRGGNITFDTPDANHYLDQIPLGHPEKMADMYELSFDDILDYLVELGERLDINKNEHMQEARGLTYAASPLTPSIVDQFYATAGEHFNRDFLREMADVDIGIAKLDGWVAEQVATGPRTRVRCFGSRALHIIPGNGPGGIYRALIRNALTRSDAIVKTPSNDPFTGPAIVRTMCEMDADHPLTQHIAIGYWKGGDTGLEEKLYQPHNIEKIIAWGGYASVKHVTKYIQPGLELISLDPKRSASVIGAECFENEDIMQVAATRLASDFGGYNQVGCTNSRVAYVMTGTDEEGLKKANQLAQMAYDALLQFPKSYSTKPKQYPIGLKEKINNLRLMYDYYHVVGGEDDEGAIVVSQTPDTLDFMPELDARSINIVPIDTLDQFLGAIDSYTQTVGVLPEELKDELKDKMPLFGCQRIVSLGYASAVTMAGPHDAIEPMARMVKWVVDEISTPEERPPMWLP